MGDETHLLYLVGAEPCLPDGTNVGGQALDWRRIVRLSQVGGEWGASFFPDRGSFRIFTGEGRDHVAGKCTMYTPEFLSKAAVEEW